MRSYRQYCAVAKALDVVGDRWTLLIVRELLLRGPCRYTDLEDGLPGIATNLLADRLRELEAAGIIEREAAPPPIATNLIRLSARGERLAPVLAELGRWGVELMVDHPPEDTFRSYWLSFPAEHILVDSRPDRPPATIEVRTGDQPMSLVVGGGSVRAHRGASDRPDVVIAGPPLLILGLLSGRIDIAEARRRGLEIHGDLATLARVRPAPGGQEKAPASAVVRRRS